jgi:hypothetical protein
VARTVTPRRIRFDKPTAPDECGVMIRSRKKRRLARAAAVQETVTEHRKTTGPAGDARKARGRDLLRTGAGNLNN